MLYLTATSYICVHSIWLNLKIGKSTECLLNKNNRNNDPELWSSSSPVL
jgi:hypothetical protein